MWLAGTKISLEAPGVWALSTATTQSSRPPASEWWPLPTIECVATQQAGRNRPSASSNTESGSRISIVVGARRSNSGLNAPGFNRIASSCSAFASGGCRTVSDASRPTPSDARIEPRCGVATKTTRVTKGSGSKKYIDAARARISGRRRISPKGRSAIASHSDVPGPTVWSFACSPPMLCPTSTSDRRAGSRPCGSIDSTAARSSDRSVAADCRNAAPVG